MIEIGDLLPSSLASIAVTDSTGAPVDAPTLPTAVLTMPDGTAGPTLTVTHPGTGSYAFSYTTTLPGLHALKWTVPGPNGGVTELTFVVEPDPIPSLVTVDEAIAQLRATGIITKAADKEQLRWLCQVATDAVERDLGRTIVPRAVTETIDGGRAALVLTSTPVISVTAVSELGTALATDGSAYTLDARAGLLYRGTPQSPRCFAGSWGAIVVTYRAGYVQPPPVARKVALNGVQRMWQGSQQVHPGFDSLNADDAVYAAAGTLTPLELGAYNSLRSVGIA